MKIHEIKKEKMEDIIIFSHTINNLYLPFVMKIKEKGEFIFVTHYSFLEKGKVESKFKNAEYQKVPNTSKNLVTEYVLGELKDTRMED